MYDQSGYKRKNCVCQSQMRIELNPAPFGFPPHLLEEIEHFFAIYKELEAKKTGVEAGRTANQPSGS